MHEQERTKDYIFERIKVDDIQGDCLIEYKKTSSNFEGTRMQVLYYLDYFNDKGVKLKGKIIDLTYHKVYFVQLNKKTKKELEELKENIKKTLCGKLPERKSKKKDCKSCSFYDYCWLE